MKKSGIVIILMLIVVLAVLSGTTFAFYSAGQVDFTFKITSETGSVLSLVIGDKSTGFSPAATNPNVDNYEVVTGDNGTYGVYCLKYISTSSTPINVKLYITGVNYKRNAYNLDSNYVSYLNENLSYGFLIKDSNFNFSIDAKGEPSTWIKPSDGSDSISFTIDTEHRTGYILCFVKFDLSEELFPETLSSTQISFTIGTEIINSAA